MQPGHEPEVLNDLPAVTTQIRVPSVSTVEPFPARGSFAPPRLEPIAAPARGRRVVAELRFPGDLVRVRANEYAQEARAAGAQHTLKLWRECCHEALIALARITTGAPADALCESLSWQLDGEDYLVSAVLVQPAAPIIH